MKTINYLQMLLLSHTIIITRREQMCNLLRRLNDGTLERETPNGVRGLPKFPNYVGVTNFKKCITKSFYMLHA